MNTTGLFTPDEIKKFAAEHSEQQLDAIISRMEVKELELYKSLVKLGDAKGVAVFTAVSEKYKECNSNEYTNAYTK